LNLRNASDNNRTVSSTSTAAPPPPNGAGSGLASLLFGHVNEFQRFTCIRMTRRKPSKSGGLHGQDSYRITQKLTVNYGVRWDIIYPETVKQNRRRRFASLVSGGTVVVVSVHRQ